ncbi:hypothetical protein [Mangrovimonas sp. TPBH4]|uniref:hypothetical protein n=1 Tax=Mangrovimonas sp. TPBH4 TaxID=1645914 RepID=UPI0006B55C83|nr:hypothetical protein [Mangrovimonas sp. TPBH4]
MIKLTNASSSSLKKLIFGIVMFNMFAVSPSNFGEGNSTLIISFLSLVFVLGISTLLIKRGELPKARLKPMLVFVGFSFVLIMAKIWL